MTEKNGQSPQSSSDQDTSSPSSPPPQIGRGAKIANDIGEHTEVLLNALRQLSRVGEDVVETNTSDEVVPSSNVEFSSSKDGNMPINDLHAKLTAYIEAPSLIERILAKLNGQKRRKNSTILHLPGQESHTSIN